MKRALRDSALRISRVASYYLLEKMLKVKYVLMPLTT